MKKHCLLAPAVLLVSLLSPTAQEKETPFPIRSILNLPTIADRSVNLDSQGKLLPWPMPDDTGYSYSSYFLDQWTIIWDQYNNQRPHTTTVASTSTAPLSNFSPIRTGPTQPAT
jgi:hypothetical protein